jgi:lipoate-protein ligase A
VGGKKIAGLSAASETGKSLLFHTSFLVDFDVELMTDIMNTPLLKLSDKGYNCFSQRVTTVRQELGKKIEVTSVMDAIQESFQGLFGIEFQEDQPDPFERETIQRFIRKVHKSGVDLFSQASEVQDGSWQAQNKGRAFGSVFIPFRRGH